MPLPFGPPRPPLPSDSAIAEAREVYIKALHKEIQLRHFKTGSWEDRIKWEQAKWESD